MINPNQCLSIQVDTATARTVPNGCVYTEGTLISYSTVPDESVEHTNRSGFWEYRRLGGVGTHQVVRSLREKQPLERSYDLPTRDAMPLHNWVDDTEDPTAVLDSYLGSPRRYDGGLFVSFHAVHIPEITEYLDRIVDAEMPRASLACLLGIALQQLPVIGESSVEAVPFATAA